MAEDGKIMRVKLENYIKTPSDIIMRYLLKRLDREKDKLSLIDLKRRLVELYRCRICNQASLLERSFDLFSGKECKVNTGALRSQDEEDMFLERLHQAMTSANFVMMRKEEYEDAIKEDFLLDLDLQMQVKKLDTSFIRRFLDKHNTEGIAPVNHAVLVYHRGSGYATDQGMFLMRKVDIVLAGVFGFIWRFILFLLSLLQVWKLPSMLANMKAGGYDADFEDDDEGYEGLEYERKTLRQHLAKSWVNFFLPVKLKEPTFREMIVVYRSKAALPKLKDGETLDDFFTPITVKSFQDIPRADFEIVLPEVNPATRTLDLLKMGIALLVGGATIGMKLSSISPAELDDPMTVLKSLIPVLTGVGSYVAKIAVQFQAAQARYTQLITQYLYDKSMDSGQGVRTALVDSQHRQEVKEALLAYYYLWQGKAQTMGELDDIIEEALKALGDEIDFEVDDALEKLIRDKLVQIDTPTLTPLSLIRPLTITRAMQRVNILWERYFTDPGNVAECPYCPYFGGEGHNEPGDFDEV